MTRPFATASRYYSSETLEWTDANGDTHVYLSRRFVPAAEEFTLLHEHGVAAGDRVDTITAHYLDDPEQFWRICDANNALRPDELTEEPGRKLRITLPQGIAGPR